MDKKVGQTKYRLEEVGPSLDTSPQEISGVVSSPTVANGVVYFGGLDGKLYAVIQ
jgi:outer membrane protein assembly factor BamB